MTSKGKNMELANTALRGKLVPNPNIRRPLKIRALLAGLRCFTSQI
jgi:hypothetical protein